MKHQKLNTLLLLLGVFIVASSCVSKKAYTDMQMSLEAELAEAARERDNCLVKLDEANRKLSKCESDQIKLEGRVSSLQTELNLRQEQVADLREQRDKQVEQVGDLTVLSKSANENIKETLSQLEKKDKYIQLLYAAKTKADSINLALAVNLKSALKDGIEDEDVEVKVDKTVVFINLSDKMLYQSGSANITERAGEVLAKIARIIESRPELEVMVEGYTDNVPINTECIQDNWDLSVRRATSVVRALQNEYGVDPNKLIAAGRGEYNQLVSNDTPEGRATNRRTRIIILPKLNQFYDLLNPNLATKTDEAVGD